MKDKLKKIFRPPTNLVRDVKQEQVIKMEPVMEAQNVYYNSSRGKFNSYRGRGRGGARGRESFG